ncbi:MAG: phosphatase PAP2 family protein [Cytophagales bacterium]|nr:phosphatase PAP2 family protein [Cytophagales bacterium]
MNQALFLWLNSACAALPDWLWASLTITGHTSVIFALCTPLMLPQLKRSDVMTGLFISAVVGGMVSTTLKEWLQILRPPAVLAPEQFHLIGHKLELVSFPSGHTLSAFVAASLLIAGFKLRGWRLIGILCLASWVGLSRIAVGAHWPLDVLVGALLGFGCGQLGWQLACRLHQRAWTHGVIYLSCQSVILLLISASLFVTNMGYPDAVMWQYASAGFGLICAAYSLLMTLKLRKPS